jgi:phage terminase, large subunit, PBSX family
MLDTAETFGISRYMDFRASDFSIRFPVFRSEILFAGLDDPEKLKSIVGITSGWIEEASEAESADCKELNRRLRGETPGYKQIILTANPVAGALWMKKDLVDTGKARFLKSTYRDNRFLDAEYIAELESETDAYHRSVYTDGDFAVLRGLVFSNVIFQPFNYLADAFPTIYQGLDFGFNDPAAAIRCGIRDQELYILEEFYQRGLTNSDLVKALKGAVLDPRRLTVADSAEPDRIVEFKRDGYKVEGARKGKDSIKTGLDYLKRFKAIHVDPHKTPNLARELAEYKYAESRDGIVSDLPVPKNDHAIDALRYATEPLWNRHTLTVSSVTAADLGIY